ncbi:response regulator [Opitutus sp. GAS368]|uniref:response regulator n=1 Tax=Opitutus sp. GAS368 TaxID=1882749 RepID=UPI00087C84A3|nr:response regulator [Opitutus sp. GAS368]SDR68542.1 two-component system, cell cycle response regulator/two-component system, chemotaxis family, response regulator CheY [Opitutus sp. GAS368]
MTLSALPCLIFASAAKELGALFSFYPLMRPTILTVDDSKALRLLVGDALGKFDCETNEAANGFNAFFAIERARPDLILLDISMPVMNGVEMLSRLKASPELQTIPVLMLTSPADHAVIPQLASLGASDTLMKPFNAAALIDKIGRILELKPRGP